MSGIPDFIPAPPLPYSILPCGVHQCEEPAFRERFDEGFPTDNRRKFICEGFFRLRAELVSLGVVGTQWVDGSFVEAKPNPGDVDVVTFCDYDRMNGLPPAAQAAVVPLLGGGEATKATYHAHTFLVPCCPPGHGFHAIFEQARLYWRRWFGKTRPIRNPPGPDLPGVAKGLIQMVLGPEAEAPCISSDGGVP